MDDSKIRNMEQFARVSGISRPTVSKYFNDPSSVRPKTRARIEEALEQYDYRPNIFAVNQNRRLTKNIGIVVPYLADPFFAEIARNIEQRCMQAGFWPTLFSAHGDSALEVEILDSLRSLKPAGVLLAPLGRASDRAAVEKFCDDVPTVLFDSNIEGVGEAFVGSDNTQFVKLSVEYLCRTGQPPCFFEMPPVNPNANKRRNGYIQAMEANGFDPQVIRVAGEGWGFEEVGYRGGLDVIDRGLLTSDTVLCSNDRLAIGFLAACYERGMRVGRDADCALRVAGHDDHPFSRFGCPPLTTIAQDYEKISERSVEALFHLIEGGRSAGPRIETLFEGKLVMRASA
ncbi:LacI family DNA-binding transcriptional regulator [Sulfitobacter pseudonitzschiae]|uniref:LacI family DNA-binding transcriptional regulator n=1 Tax=Pseudosulfitobacter pseudonitzschiae TaxID=1402135 RepID=A0A9Q2NK74_9RHOB|nr:MULTISPECIES: LacI family DNA-binding transcriptional regulator [Roseobacteraceae]MBM2292259.1 LacI family DNA-binding transcriptional regulator [Pseudosulfitobacter pseudonitzschiae]MBM2297177.1 LacI family DNA-binding transcriptional regulator [Pseudosulfitobacter pseudonitzschiae]MBM2302091.1 LacI family DNA-binding transcriptional regulator [Pseudosulfitobacter pseudonitzschiae]MBM2311873.1 LacI family DNA-binding transcriptional regulator [Pseudosulfitobacter pseudonitzschiae]MBM231678|tara:strand:+ start:189 stop:1217 length:1029 start_codon:yes stop_codon:yes gene_type:complete